MDHNLTEPKLMPLAKPSIIIIYDFLKFPEDQKELLRKVKIWDSENWEDSYDVGQGVMRYLEHTKHYYAIEGKLHERKAEK